MPNKGFLLVTMQPAPAFEEEFNAWYDSEHIPERLAVPGILTARRYVCADGHPKFLAMYDLESHAVMQSPGYVRVGYENASPWTKRVTSRVKPWRSTGDQLWPGSELTKGGSAVLLVRFRNLPSTAAPEVVEAARKVFEARPETLQLRMLAHNTGEAAVDLMAFVEQRVPLADIDLAIFGRFADRIDLFNIYRPY